MKITIGKKRGNTPTLTCVDIEKLADKIRQTEYGEEVERLRTIYPVTVRNIKDQPDKPKAAEALPSICFAAEYANRAGKQIMLKRNAAFIIEVNHLAGYQEVEYLRDIAAELPQTMMAFMGASGRSLKIVCKARWENMKDGMSDDEWMEKIREAYANATKYYATQMYTSIDIRIPTMTSGCKMSADPHVYFNPNAEDFFVSAVKHRTSKSGVTSLAKDDARLLPGYNLHDTQRLQFENYLCQAVEATLNLSGVKAEEEALYKLAKMCREDDLPKEMCIYRTLRHPDFTRDEAFIRSVFDNFYKKKLKERNPLSNFTPEVLLTLKTKDFMQTHFEMRRNILTGVVEYRKRDGRGLPFKDLTTYGINSMTLDALAEGLKSWDKDMKRYIESDKIEEYDPIDFYLNHLPAWDGKDYIGGVARRIPTDDKNWEQHFHVWILAMVAHWMGKDQIHGNAYTPMLIGKQGDGKSTFCRKLLPKALDSYYYDQLDFKNEQSADLALTRYALINLDEFDKMTNKQQATLKYLLQKSMVKTRRPYGKAIEELRRFASFIATTNNYTPLVDPSGSRRFICITVKGVIDNESPLDYNQIYAQAVAEINAGEKFWFDDQETAEIMKHNEVYRTEDGLSAMLVSCLSPTTNDSDGEWLTVTKIMKMLRKQYRNLKDDDATLQKLGHKLAELNFKHKRIDNGKMGYLCKIIL